MGEGFSATFPEVGRFKVNFLRSMKISITPNYFCYNF